MKVKSESEVAQSCQTLCDPMDCRLPGSSVRGIFQARVLEWGATALSGYYVSFQGNFMHVKNKTKITPQIQQHKYKNILGLPQA